MILRGRRKITSEFTSNDLMNVEILNSVLRSALITHLYNKDDIDYLIDYKNGRQTILDKIKAIRPEINNKLVINHAQMITRNIVGYFLGTPIQYIQNGINAEADRKNDIDTLNRVVSYEDKSTVDTEIGEYQSICGTAYRIIYSDSDNMDDVPFEDRALNPSTTFVVYENNISEKPLLGVTYYPIKGERNEVVGWKYYCYTTFGVYEIRTVADFGVIGENDTMNFTPYNVGGIPIIEYPNNMWRLGDWELCIGLMDAINALYSGRLDDIDQIVQSLLVFINADIDSQTYEEMLSLGAVMLKNNSGNPSDVKTVNTALEQGGMNAFAGELKEMLYAIIGIPDRNNRAGGGGDTGMAVELRDGWADLEVIARSKEATFKKSEKKALKIMLTILNNTMGTSLQLLDIDVKFSRNKNNNLLVKTQSYQTLLATKTLSPHDCLTIVDLVSDVNDYIERGKAFWGTAFADLEQATTTVEASKVALDNVKNPPPETGTGVKQTGQNKYNEAKKTLGNKGGSK